MAIYTIRSGVTNHPEDTFLQHLTAHVRKGGVVSKTSDFLASEPSGGGLNVDIGSGHAFVKGATGNAYPVRSTTTETVAINANASGSPRITSIVLVVDLNTVPVSEDQGDDVAVFETVDGTPAGSPIAPSDSAIQSAVGAGNPWIRICDVTVSSGASGISDVNITDRRTRVYLRSISELISVPYTSSFTPDFSDSNQQAMTLTGNVAVSEPDNMEIGDILLLRFLQDGTGGRTVSFDFTVNEKSVDFSNNTTANKATIYALHKVSEGAFDGYLVGKDY